MKSWNEEKLEKKIEELENQKYDIDNKIFQLNFVLRVLKGEDEKVVLKEASEYGFHPIDMKSLIANYK